MALLPESLTAIGYRPLFGRGDRLMIDEVSA